MSRIIESDIERRVLDVVQEYWSDDGITLKSKLREDLEMDEDDIVELSLKVEAEFLVSLSSPRGWRKVRDISESVLDVLEGGLE